MRPSGPAGTSPASRPSSPSSSTSFPSRLTTTAEPGGPGRRGRRILGTVLGVVLSVALLAWAMRGVSLAEVGSHLARARLGPLALAVLVATSTFAIRAIRWRYLLRTETGERVSWRALWHGT